MYHAALVLTFLLFALPRGTRKVWLVLALVSACELSARLIYDHNDPGLYIMRSTATLLGGLALCRTGTWLGRWQVRVYAATVAAYVALAFDVVMGRHVLIYNYFEGVIYGLVACQLAGILPAIRNFIISSSATNPFGLGDLRGSKGQ